MAPVRFNKKIVTSVTVALAALAGIGLTGCKQSCPFPEIELFGNETQIFEAPEPFVTLPRDSSRTRVPGVQSAVKDASGDYLYMADGGAAKIYALDLKTNEKVNTIRIRKDSVPTGMAYDAERELLYVCSTNHLFTVVDVSNMGKATNERERVIAELDTFPGPCYDITYKSSEKIAYVTQWTYTHLYQASGDDSKGTGGVFALDLTNSTSPSMRGEFDDNWIIKHADMAQVTCKGETPRLQGIEQDEQRGLIFTVRYGCFGDQDENLSNLFILRDDGSSLNLVSKLTFASGLFQLAYDSERQYLFVGLFDTTQVAAVDVSNPENPQILAYADLGRVPGDLRFDGARKVLYVATRPGTVAAINVSDDAIDLENQTMPLMAEVVLQEGCGANALCFDADRDTLYAPSLDANRFCGCTAVTAVPGAAVRFQAEL